MSPDIIKPIYETENQYSKYDNTLSGIMDKACMDSNAKYVALCEGDDYWIDPLKLQKQIDFLESHPDYSMVFADVRIQKGDEITYESNGFENRTYTPTEFYSSIWAPTCTIVFRMAMFDSICHKTLQSSIKRPVFNDLTMVMACTTIGKAYGMSDIVGVYRKLPTGASWYLWRHPYLNLKNRLAISKYFGKEYIRIDQKNCSGWFFLSLKRIHKDFPEHLKLVCRLFWFAPWECIKQIRTVPEGIHRIIARRIEKR